MEKAELERVKETFRASRAKRNLTPEEVGEELWEIEEDLLRDRVATALSRVPIRVADSAINGCLFVMPTQETRGQCFSAKQVRGRAVLAFSEVCLRSLAQDEAERLVLHEVAHYWLKHITLSSPLPTRRAAVRSYNAQERAAWQQVEKWLQPHATRRGQKRNA